jgi:predicted GIY-YIG superfamily endonuclease
MSYSSIDYDDKIDDFDIFLIPTYLYKLYDQNNKLLYIGITTDYKVRFKNHANNQSWWNKVSRHWIKKYPSRTSALRAEKRIIARQKPKYNITYNSQV